MDNTIWIPTVMSIASLLWNYNQSKKILKLEADAERKNLIHKLQFEKEFEVYKELWASLVDLKNTTLSLRPMLDYREHGKSEDEIKAMRLTSLSEKLNAVAESFDKNRPFYPHHIYKEIAGLWKLAKFEGIDYQHGERNDPIKYWEQAEANGSKLTNSMDKIAELIRKRIEVVDVRG